jgi:hypothetical protein
MARSFASIVAQPYNLALYGLPINLGLKKIAQPKMVVANIAWANYGASVAVPNVGVFVNLLQGVVNPLDRILSIYIDNTNSNIPVYVQFQDTGFTVSCPPNSEVWSPVITNLLSAKIYGEGFTVGTQPSTNVFFLNTIVNPFGTSEVPTSYPQYLASTNVIGADPIFGARYGNPALGDLTYNALLNLASIPGEVIVLPASLLGGVFIINSVDFTVANFGGAAGYGVLSLYDPITTGVYFASILYCNGTAVPFIRPYQNSGFNVKLDATHSYYFALIVGLNLTGFATMNIQYTYQPAH